MEKNKCRFHSFWNTNLRQLLKDANSVEISKDELVGIFKSGDQFALVYYR